MPVNAHTENPQQGGANANANANAGVMNHIQQDQAQQASPYMNGAGAGASHVQAGGQGNVQDRGQAFHTRGGMNAIVVAGQPGSGAAQIQMMGG